MGHDHEADVPGLQAAASKLRGHVLAGLHSRLGERADEATEVGCGLRGHGGMQAGVDQEGACGRMVDEEGRTRHPPPLGAWRPDPQVVEVLEAPTPALEHRRRSLKLADAQRLDDNRRTLLPARKRRLEGLRLGVDLHGGQGSGGCAARGDAQWRATDIFRGQWLRPIPPQAAPASSRPTCSRARSRSSRGPDTGLAAPRLWKWHPWERWSSAAAGEPSLWRRWSSRSAAPEAGRSTRLWTSATPRRLMPSSTTSFSAMDGSTLSSTTRAVSSWAPPRRSRQRGFGP